MMLLTQLHTAFRAVQGIYRIDIDSSDPDKEFRVYTRNQMWNNTYDQYHLSRTTNWGIDRYLYHGE